MSIQIMNKVFIISPVLYNLNRIIHYNFLFALYKFHAYQSESIKKRCNRLHLTQKNMFFEKISFFLHNIKPDRRLIGFLLTFQVRPEKIRAEDKDTLRTEVEYSFLTDSSIPNLNNFEKYFTIHPKTGIVSQIRPVDREETSEFNLLIKVRRQIQNR